MQVYAWWFNMDLSCSNAYRQAIQNSGSLIGSRLHAYPKVWIINLFETWWFSEPMAKLQLSDKYTGAVRLYMTIIVNSPSSVVCWAIHIVLPGRFDARDFKIIHTTYPRDSVLYLDHINIMRNSRPFYNSQYATEWCYYTLECNVPIGTVVFNPHNIAILCASLLYNVSMHFDREMLLILRIRYTWFLKVTPIRIDRVYLTPNENRSVAFALLQIAYNSF